ncbi:hypothetical protein BAY60_14785 [Prauserella muralis]|uniref:Uncharacterized protein n=1 Tax=Prauserella muralis TaxID=588067 RepID=A0A2V4B0E6_9PSEU|nr:hypothetical protein BAY60_14785 [Prauserella muralis]
MVVLSQDVFECVGVGLVGDAGLAVWRSATARVLSSWSAIAVVGKPASSSMVATVLRNTCEVTQS